MLSNCKDDYDVYLRFIHTGIFNPEIESFYVIKKVIDPGIPVGSIPSFEDLQKFNKHNMELNEEWFSNIVQKLRLLRLFKEGNIVSPLQYIYLDFESPISSISYFSYGLVLRDRYTLDDSEIDNLNEFINKNELPFEDNSLNNAFQSFELSYNIIDSGLALVSCMTALECLLSPNDKMIAENISKNMGKLIGKDMKSSENVYSRLRELYKKRSELIHTGHGNITHDDLKDARNFVREAIKQYLLADLSKPELIKKLKAVGNLKEGKFSGTLQ